jgi:hypothetical protein
MKLAMLCVFRDHNFAEKVGRGMIDVGNQRFGVFRAPVFGVGIVYHCVSTQAWIMQAPVPVRRYLS